MKLEYKFLKSIPSHIDSNTLYISCDYKVAIHKCCCGCGNKVVTPFSPKGWHLVFKGETVSLYPSIGNWSFPCQSHYWIVDSKVKVVPQGGKKGKKQITTIRKGYQCIRKGLKKLLYPTFRRFTGV